MLDRIREDIDSILQRDPAARSALEVLLCSPGLHAVWAHRVHHWLWLRDFRLIARILSQVTRFWTGVEIHPGAVIGRRLFIDHGMGVVIGETAVVGNDVTLYQGVTLGGTGSAKAGGKPDGQSRAAKRHPTLCDRVFVGNNANVLGDITIGANSRVGAGSVVLRDVPPNSTVVGVPAHIVYRNGQRVLITDPHEVKDPLSDALIALAQRVDKLERLDTAGRLSPAAAQTYPDSFAAEDEEREAYRQELEQLRDYVSMGGGI
jgi:serine O-acetyltransferase